MSEPKRVNRFPPCPLYDVEGIESWLEDQARQGLILTKTGLFCGFAEFEKLEPKPMRYRLQPLPKKKFMEDAGPTDAAVELAEEYGWEYLCCMGEFAVFGCADPAVRELDTDPRVQALLYQQMYRRKRNSFFSNVVLFLLVVGLIGWLGPLTYLLDQPGWYTGFLAMIWLALPFVTHQELKQLKYLKQKLSLGEPLSRKKDWRKTRAPHFVSAGLTAILLPAFYLILILNNFLGWQDGRWMPIAQYQGNLPFGTMEQIAGKGTLEDSNWATDHNNELAVRSTVLAQTQITFDQTGEVKEDGVVYADGSLQVDYYDMRTEWLAKELFQEIHRAATRSKGKYHHYADLEDPALPADQVAAYSSYYPTLLLRDGTRVLRVQFFQFDQRVDWPLEHWAEAVAEPLLCRQ